MSLSYRVTFLCNSRKLIIHQKVPVRYFFVQKVVNWCYHLVMVVKYRRKVIDDQISERAKEIFEYIAPNYGIVLEEWNHDIDHVHVMFRAQPKRKYQNLSMLIRVRAVG